VSEATPLAPPARPARPALDLAAAARQPADQVLRALGSAATGLSAAQAAERLGTVGPNVLAAHRVTAWAVLGRQLRNPLLVLLLAAAGVAAATGDPTDAAIIAAIVGLSVGLGFVNEYRSELAVAALHAGIRHQTLVRRDGRQQRLDVRDLVPGDVVALQVGDLVPADLRLLEADQLECDEAVLTGESQPAVKQAAASPAGDSPVDLPSCAFMGTVVHQGAGVGVVVATGSATAFGKIAVGLGERPPETAFQAGLRAFSKLLVRVAAVLTGAILVVNLAVGRPLLEAVLFCLAIAIGITPQLLPAIVSVSLAAGSRALARRRVLVKRLVAIEDLGNIQLLFTDKTGTLTQGAIGFDRALDPAGRPATRPLLLGLVCNQATMTEQGPVGGNALDVALWSAAAAAGPELAAGGGPGAYRRLGLVPFDHERQLASVAVRTPDATALLVTKGAPEAVLARCVEVPAGARATLARLFAEGARVVAVASRDAPGLTSPSPADEHGLHLVGLLSFVDRPKADAGRSIARLATLGVTVKVITGDNGTVAAKLCRDLGVPVEQVRTGAELARLDDDALAAAIAHTTVFARVSPEQKARIVKVARGGGADVAFLGDGVNDAVALHAADVGISVDSASDVAKDAADVVLLDKDLGVLADGVTEGRRIFANTLKYVLMATSSNFEHVQRRWRVAVPVVPADAAVPDPAEQPALRRRPARHPRRPGGPRGAGQARRVGHRLRAPVHGRVRTGQLAVRLPDVRGDARTAARRPWRVPQRLVRGVAGHPDPGGVRDPHPPGAVLPQPPEPGDAGHPGGVRAGRRRAAVFAAGPPAGFRDPAAGVLPDPAGDDRRVPGPRRAGQAPLLRRAGAPRQAAGDPAGAAQAARPAARRPLHPPRRPTVHPGHLTVHPGHLTVHPRHLTVHPGHLTVT
jgi:Mg2+-importing ATPase